MAIIEKSIKSKCDNLNIGITIVTPAKNRKVKDIIQVVIGIEEDRKKYMPFLNFLARKGYVAVINNHRGTGDSIKSKEELGNVFDSTARYIIDDLYQITQLIKEDYPDKKVILIGNGIGSLIAANYIQKYDGEIDKLIISGQISKSNVLFDSLIIFIVNLIKGNKYRSIKLNNLFLSTYLDNYKDIEDDKNELNLTTSQLENIFKLHCKAYDEKKYKVNNRDLKILIMSGTENTVIINEDKFYESCYFLKDIGYSTDYILYKDKVYDLLNSDFENIIHDDILEFIEES